MTLKTVEVTREGPSWRSGAILVEAYTKRGQTHQADEV